MSYGDEAAVIKRSHISPLSLPATPMSVQTNVLHSLRASFRRKTDRYGHSGGEKDAYLSFVPFSVLRVVFLCKALWNTKINK